MRPPPSAPSRSPWAHRQKLASSSPATCVRDRETQLPEATSHVSRPSFPSTPPSIQRAPYPATSVLPLLMPYRDGNHKTESSPPALPRRPATEQSARRRELRWHRDVPRSQPTPQAVNHPSQSTSPPSTSTTQLPTPSTSGIPPPPPSQSVRPTHRRAASAPPPRISTLPRDPPLRSSSRMRRRSPPPPSMSRQAFPYSLRLRVAGLRLLRSRSGSRAPSQPTPLTTETGRQQTAPFKTPTAL